MPLDPRRMAGMRTAVQRRGGEADDIRLRGIGAEQLAAAAPAEFPKVSGRAFEGGELVRTLLDGRKALFINPVYTLSVEGLDAEESQALLGALFAHMLQDRFIYRHAWRADMLTMWDNRRATHNATGGYDGHLRLMHRTTVAGERPV